MNCDHCHEQEATIHIEQQGGPGDGQSLHLCGSCAAQASLSPGSLDGFALADLLLKCTDLLGHREEADAPAMTCPDCGLTTAMLRETGRLGCARCYETFAVRLHGMLERLQHGLTHCGKAPGVGRVAPAGAADAAAGELQGLRQDLSTAVSVEDYERAAELRDRIAELLAALPSESQI